MIFRNHKYVKCNIVLAAFWVTLLFLPTPGSSTPSFPEFVKDINPGSAGSDILGGFDYNGKFLFNAVDGEHGYELWTSDGTDIGTTMIKDLIPGPSSGGAAFLTSFQGLVYFLADNPETGGEWWKTDGSEAGTTVAVDIVPGPAGSNAFPVCVLGDKMILAVGDGSTKLRLWRSDGTEAGTQIIPGQPDFDGGDGILTLYGIVFGGNYYCFIQIGGHGEFGGGEYDLCKTDGNTFSIVKFINPYAYTNEIGYGGPAYLTESSGFLYFAGDNGLWRSDGTSEGTVNVYSQESHIVDVNGTLIEPMDELYYWDGTSTILLKDIYPGSSSSGPTLFSDLWHNKRLFRATDNAHGMELWITDGTADGTNFVYDFNPGVGNSFPLFQAYDSLDFNVITADNPTYGREIWITDGMTAGTYVMDLYPGPTSSGVSGGWLSGQYIYLKVDDGIHGKELWKMDIGDTSSISDWQMYK
jgi:ELWxxDGT repeat protein